MRWMFKPKVKIWADMDKSRMPNHWIIFMFSAYNKFISETLWCPRDNLVFNLWEYQNHNIMDDYDGLVCALFMGKKRRKRKTEIRSKMSKKWIFMHYHVYFVWFFTPLTTYGPNVDGNSGSGSTTNMTRGPPWNTFSSLGNFLDSFYFKAVYLSL